MTDEELKRYEDRKREAAARVDEWFIQSPDHWRGKAQEIAILCDTWNYKTYWRRKAREAEEGQSPGIFGLREPLTPNAQAVYELLKTLLGYRMSVCSTDASPEFHPLAWWTDPIRLKLDYIKGTVTIPPFPERDADKAVACYYAALIVLHDTAGQGYMSIAADIWPESLCALAAYAFHPQHGNKSGFIDTALRHVEADMQNGTNQVRPAARTPGTPTTKGLSATEERAWQSYAWVCENHRALIPTDGRKYTPEMYEAALESPAYQDDAAGKPSSKLGFSSWKRYVSGYMRKAPKKADNRIDLRPEEIASQDNVEDRADLTNRFQPPPKSRRMR